MSINPYLHVMILLSASLEDFALLKCDDKSAIMISTVLSKSLISSLSTMYFDFL
jgi:hypothetical protein